MIGYVYVMTNPAMPGLVKIGYTTGLPADRARELSAASGVPVPFFVEFSIEVDEPFMLEALVHDQLAGFRLNPSREFFRTSPARAADVIATAAASPEFWAAAMNRVWNRGSAEWRERWLDGAERSVFDTTGAGGAV